MRAAEKIAQSRRAHEPKVSCAIIRYEGLIALRRRMMLRFCVMRIRLAVLILENSFLEIIARKSDRLLGVE